MNAIAHAEGFYDRIPQSGQKNIPQRLNNPGNLTHVDGDGYEHEKLMSGRGKDRKLRDFAKFDTVQQGWAALRRQLLIDADISHHKGPKRNLSIEKEIHKYVNDSNEVPYLARVMKSTGIKSKDTKLNDFLSGSDETQPNMPLLKSSNNSLITASENNAQQKLVMTNSGKAAVPVMIAPSSTTNHNQTIVAPLSARNPESTYQRNANSQFVSN